VQLWPGINLTIFTVVKFLKLALTSRQQLTLVKCHHVALVDAGLPAKAKQRVGGACFDFAGGLAVGAGLVPAEIAIQERVQSVQPRHALDFCKARYVRQKSSAFWLLLSSTAIMTACQQVATQCWKLLV
jgi:hypothetical protein